jgi:chorismate mutase
MQNADAIIEACKKTLASLDKKAEPEWQETLNNVISVLEDLKARFFLKTNLAIPVTNACLKDATELQSIAANNDLSKFSEVLTRLRTDVETLLKHAKMEGISLT